MALSNAAIGNARLTIGKIKGEIVMFNQGVKRLQYVLETAENYQKFVSGTEYGNKFNAAIDEIESICNDVFANIENVNNKTTTFLNRQEELNREGR